MRRGTIYYGLVDDREEVNEQSIYAISNDQREILQYIDQFPNTFTNLNEFRIQTIYDSNIIKRLEDYKLEWLNSEIILTRWEMSYYDKKFRQMYENVKIMITTSFIMNHILDVDMKDKMIIKSFSDMIYSEIKSYQDFLNLLNKEAMFPTYIMDPNQCKIEIELDNEYTRKMEED